MIDQNLCVLKIRKKGIVGSQELMQALHCMSTFDHCFMVFILETSQEHVLFWLLQEVLHTHC